MCGIRAGTSNWVKGVKMSEGNKVLIVEDEKDISELMSLHLKREGHQVVSVDNGEEALRQLSTNAYQLLVLDWMLPGLSGLEVCKRVRGDGKGGAQRVPILMVTARVHASDIVLGLETGADDYLTKPFEIPVFLARVRALLRRLNEPEEETANVFTLGELTVDCEAHSVFCGKKEVQLTPSEFKLLVALLRNQGRVLTRERLIELVQGEGVTVIDRSVDTHVFGLRKKLGKSSELIETIRGVGYRINN
jgi:two-component system phosphate regulon response regulator PhoB